MVVLEVTLTLAAIAVCCTGVGILVCCVAWLRRSESVWTKAEKEEEIKKKTKKEEQRCSKTKLKQHRRTRFANVSAYEVPVSIRNTSGPAANSVQVHVAQNTSGLAANNMETAQNEAYIETRHLVHYQEHNSQAANRKSTTCSTMEIRAVQNTSYEPKHSSITEPGHVYRPSASDDDLVYTYITSEQENSAVMNMASNVAYIHSHHQHTTLDVIYEETQSDSIASRDNTQAWQNSSDCNLNTRAYTTKSETTL